MTSDRAEEQEGFVRGFHGIPDSEKLNAMSFAELASLLSSCEKDSPKFLVVERELKKYIAKDQAAINLKNILVGAFIGGVFGWAGVVIGFYLGKQEPNPNTTEKIEKRQPNQNLPAAQPVEPITKTIPSRAQPIKP